MNESNKNVLLGLIVYEGTKYNIDCMSLVQKSEIQNTLVFKILLYQNYSCIFECQSDTKMGNFTPDPLGQTAAEIRNTKAIIQLSSG